MRDLKAKAAKILRDMENLRKNLESIRGEADDAETYRLIKALDMADTLRTLLERRMNDAINEEG